MRLALKHQIILAPAVVLFLMTLLLAFLQFTYWDLSVKRQQANALKSAFIALAEAEMAAKRMQSVLHVLEQHQAPETRLLEQMAELHLHLAHSAQRLAATDLLPPASFALLDQAVKGLNPEHGIRLEQFGEALGLLQPLIGQLLEDVNARRSRVAAVHREDIDELVAQTTFVSIVVLALAILVGIALSLTFARGILRRLKTLSDSAERIVAGDLSPPPAPLKIRDELDMLSASINRMTEQLIRVVSAEKLLEGAEEERRRIAMDIHDQTLADLSAVHRGLEQLSREARCGCEVATIEADLQRAIGNLRAVMDDLHPQTLDILGLPAALESHLEKVCSGGHAPDFHFLAADEVTGLALPKATQLSLYRIAIEAINNVLRHAAASRLEVGLTVRGTQLVVAVEDNGRGFDFQPTLPGSAGGRGLHNMLERARSLGAAANWGPSRFSSGTRFELALPLPAQRPEE
ncbi:MAG: HAMP domain-containing protein [Desulfuromonadales bacterium]|nr:HAMP domain-containing protein [Desulfuromonadales bacterium]